jgi:hypothetical protein
LPDADAGSPVFGFASMAFDINFPRSFSAALARAADICLVC